MSSRAPSIRSLRRKPWGAVPARRVHDLWIRAPVRRPGPDLFGSRQRHDHVPLLPTAPALKILAGREPVHLLVTDVGLPGGMNGRQLAEAARLARKDLEVLLITGYAENAAVGSGHLEPGMAVLAKPFAMSTLANRVREMLEA